MPDGWTDDMSVEIKTGKSNMELSIAIMESLKVREPYEHILKKCVEEFGLSEEDADLAIDRAQGGIVRAITCNKQNEPDKTKDPIAWHTFNEVWKTLPKVNWWSNKRDNKGEWLNWYNEQSGNNS